MGNAISLFVATPMYAGQCHASYMVSMLRMAQIMPIIFSYTTNIALITQARNFLADEFLGSDASHLLFVDSDIGFRAEDVPPMIAADRDIICGLYARKDIDWERVAQAARDGVPAPDLPDYASRLVGASCAPYGASKGVLSTPVEILCGGTGFMLIKRETLEGLAVPSYNNDSQPPKRIKQFFDTSIDPHSGILLPEDFSFCKLARDNGYGVWVAPWAELTHTGSYQFTSRYSERGLT